MNENVFSLRQKEDANSIAQAAMGGAVPMLPEEIVAQLAHYQELLAATRDPGDKKQEKADFKLYQSLADRLSKTADKSQQAAPMPNMAGMQLPPEAMAGMLPDMEGIQPPQGAMQLPPEGIPNELLGNPANIPFGTDPQMHAQAVQGQQSAPGQSPKQDGRMKAMREFLMKGRN